MKAKAVGLVGGMVFGFTLAWARLTDPQVIRDMLLLREPHVFLIMASAIVVSSIGVRLLKASGSRTMVTSEPIRWSVEPPRPRHVAGSMLFGLGWTVAGTCPGPAAAMIGEGRLIGLPVAIGLFTGVILQRVFVASKNVESPAPTAATVGL